MKLIAVRLPEQIITVLNDYIAANSQGDVKLTPSSVVRDALIQYFSIDYKPEIVRGGRRPGAGRKPTEK